MFLFMSDLRILDEKQKRNELDILDSYPNCKCLIININSIEDITGNLYAVSPTIDSFDEICEYADKFANNGVLCIIVGSYNGDGIGVQYEVNKN